MLSRLYIFIALLFLATPIFAQDSQKSLTPILGKILFPTSANQAAENYFTNGILLLHSFEYDRARTFFQQAETADPSFALAYWGEAMTYNQPVWNDQDLTLAKKY